MCDQTVFFVFHGVLIDFFGHFCGGKTYRRQGVFSVEIIGTGNLIKFNFQHRVRMAVIIPHKFYVNFISNQPKPSGRRYIAQDIDKPDIYYNVQGQGSIL